MLQIVALFEKYIKYDLIEYGLEVLKQSIVYDVPKPENHTSISVMKRVGMR
jgi:RimJ/RimL family protein N-acetyltransferase